MLFFAVIGHPRLQIIKADIVNHEIGAGSLYSLWFFFSRLFLVLEIGHRRQLFVVNGLSWARTVEKGQIS